MGGVVVFGGLYLGACSTDPLSGELLENRPPVVWLTAAPPEGSETTYHIRLYWGGWDPDGRVSHYEYAITDNVNGIFNRADTTGDGKWHPVFRSDSTFTFTCDLPTDSAATDPVTRFERSHTFFIRAVDQRGARSRDAAHRSFTSWTLSPFVYVEIPLFNQQSPAQVTPATTFRWRAYDYDKRPPGQEPDSVRHILHYAEGGNFQAAIDWVAENPFSEEWSDWVHYRAPGDSGRSWTSPAKAQGTYVFVVQAKDEAGAVTPVFDNRYNVRRVQVSERATGPLLKVFSNYVGGVISTIRDKPPLIVDLPAGLPVRFSWSATAEHYGGIVPAYRYGWDIADLSDPNQWDVSWTPFTSGGEPVEAESTPRQFSFGTHTFIVEVTDNSGIRSRVTVKINYLRFTMERSLMLVDDFPEGTFSAGWDNPQGRGILPSDQEHDAFWYNMLINVDGFDPTGDVLEVARGDEISLATMTAYKSIIWSVFGARLSLENLPLLYDFVRYRPKRPTTDVSGKQVPNLISLFMEAGGHLFVCGNHPVQLNVNREEVPAVRYPFMFLYDHEGGQNATPDYQRSVGRLSFGYNDLCLETVDYGYASPNSHRVSGYYCPVSTHRVKLRTFEGDVERDDGMREAIPLDPNFPVLTLRPEAAGPGKAYQPSERSYDVEVYNPQYFFDNCGAVAGGTRWCFEPIYALVSLDTLEATYMQPIAFWTSTYADRVPDVVGGVSARSVVWGFPPVFMKPSEVKPAIEYILFDEWQLPRRE